MRTIVIVKSADVSWEEYRDLRLEALNKEPQAFGSSYESEKQSTDEEWQKRLKRYQERIENWMVFASNEKELVGMVGAWQAKDEQKKHIAHVMAMFVSHHARMKGIATMLMKSLLEELKDSGIVKVKLGVSVEQTAAVRLYENVGFTILGKEDQLLGDGKYHEVYLMEKKIK